MPYRHRRNTRLCAAILSLTGLSAPATAVAWEWLLTPYIWASDTSATMTASDTSVEGGIEFNDLIDVIDMAAQVHLEGSGERAGFFLDLTYLSVNEHESREPSLPLDGDLRLETKVDMLLVEAAGTYRLWGDLQGRCPLDWRSSGRACKRNRTQLSLEPGHSCDGGGLDPAREDAVPGRAA